MARAFATASNQYFNIASAVATAAPMTVSLWFNVIETATADNLFAITATGSNNEGFRILVSNSDAKLYAATRAGGSQQSSISGSAISTGTWQHGAGVFASSTSRTVYLDGTAGAANTNASAPAGVNTTTIGAYNGATIVNPTGGSIAEVGVWNVALSASEITSLAAGYSPLLVRPQSLVAYWPLFARATNEESWVGAFLLTNTNSATAAQHPNRIIYPARPRIIIPAAAVGGTTVARLVNGGLVHGGTLMSGRLVREAA